MQVFVLDYQGDLYEQSLPVFFLSRLRPQERFNDAKQLVMQMDADVKRARAVFKRSFDINPDWYSGFLMSYTEILKKLGYDTH